MEILKEEVLGKVIGGNYNFQDHVDNFVEGLADGLCKDIGPISVVRGAAQIVDNIKDNINKENSPWITPFAKSLGTIAGGAAQTYAVVKWVQSVYKKLSQNEHFKKFFS